MKPRPEVVRGRTYEVMMNRESLYITINDDEEQKPFEVFVTIGKSGGFTASFTEAIGRLVSLCMRSGIDTKTIAKQLVGIRGPTLAFWRGKDVHSVPDAIGHVLLTRIGLTEKAIEDVESDPTVDYTQTVIVDDNSNGESH